MPRAFEDLTPRQATFTEHLTTPTDPAYCRPTAAYRMISPDCTPGSQAVGAFRMLRSPNVMEAVKGQLGLTQLGNGLKLCLRESKRRIKDDATALPAIREHRETIMDYAKLTGQLIERREIQVISDERRAILRSLLPALPVSAPSLPSSLPASASRPPSLPSDASAA